MYIYGRKPVIEAIKSGREISKIYLRYGVTGDVIVDIHRQAKKLNIPLTQLPTQKFARLGKTQQSQGVIAFIEDIRPISLSELIEIKREQDPPFFIALDSITDPHNVGAIIRSADCAGAHGIILPRKDSAGITDTVMKTSAGAASHLPVARVDDLAVSLNTLRQEGITIAGLSEDGEEDLLQFDGYRPLCVVIGSEGKGLSPAVKGLCDTLVRIPMWGQVESLNASVAAALMMYEIRRKRL